MSTTSNSIGGLRRTLGGVYKRKKELMVEEEYKVVPQDESDDETTIINVIDQNVPLLNQEEQNQLSPKGSESKKKHVLVVRDDNDSGISESASEESNMLTELPERMVQPEKKKESLIGIILQIFFPYLIAGFGMMLAGFLLDYVQVSCTINRVDIQWH